MTLVKRNNLSALALNTQKLNQIFLIAGVLTLPACEASRCLSCRAGLGACCRAGKIQMRRVEFTK